MNHPDAGARQRPLRTAASGLGALAVLSAGHLVIDAYSSAYAPILSVAMRRISSPLVSSVSPTLTTDLDLGNAR